MQRDQQAILNYGIWNYGIMELWNYGIMELWNYRIIELWNYGIQHPRHPLVEGAAPPGTHFETLRGVGLRKTTDVLEFSSTLMEQRTLDAR